MSVKLTTSSESQIKWIEINVPNAYSSKKEIKLGFTPSEENVAFDLFNTIFRGRTSFISLGEAQEVATIITNEFQTPIQVIKTLKIPDAEKETYFDIDPITNERTIIEGYTEDDVYSVDYLKLEDVSRAREIVQFTQERGFLSVKERAALHEYLNEVEAEVGYSRLLIDRITPAQKDTIGLFAAPYIEAIIDVASNIDNPVEQILGRSANYLQMGETFATLSKRDLAFCLLIQSMQNDLPSFYYETATGLKENCYESAGALQLLYKGDATLESTYKRQGAGIPTIAQQRLALLSIIEEKLDEKFGKDEMVGEQSFVKAIRARLFAEGYRLDTVKVEYGNGNTVQFLPFASTEQALAGNFGTVEEWGYSSLHTWIRNGEIVELEETQTLFNQIRSETENQMAFAELPNL